MVAGLGALGASPLAVARARKALGACPRQAGVWSHIPGGEDGSDTEPCPEEVAVCEAAASRLKEMEAHLAGGLPKSKVIDFRCVGQNEPKTPPTVAPGAQEGPEDKTEAAAAAAAAAEAAAAAAADGSSPRHADGQGQGCSFRIARVHAPLVSDFLVSNGLKQTDDDDWSLQWCGGSLRDADYRDVQEHQRINHFPGSTELTRKDCMWAHLERMRYTFGEDFNFVPETFILPHQMDYFRKRFFTVSSSGADDEPLWIVKPQNSSCGRGIFLLQDFRDLPANQDLVVSRYLKNPLLINGLKFDLRIYVLVTGFEPLRVYLYKEGLVRFATKAFSTKRQHIGDAYRHLTNYSVNKRASNFLQNREVTDPGFGHKWSLGALNRHLKAAGHDVDLIWARIMDLVVKTLLAVEPVITTRVNSLSAQESCFELYGFDVLVDEDLKPWLMEVNLSPSMGAESPLDWQVKTSLLRDAFNLVGIQSDGAAEGSLEQRRSRSPTAASSKQAKPKGGGWPVLPRRSNLGFNQGNPRMHWPRLTYESLPEPPPRLEFDTLCEYDLRILARTFQELCRRRNFICVYPTRGAIERYGPIFDVQTPMAPRLHSEFTAPVGWTSLTQVLAAALFPPGAKQAAPKEKRGSRSHAKRVSKTKRRQSLSQSATSFRRALGETGEKQTGSPASKQDAAEPDVQPSSPSSPSTSAAATSREPPPMVSRSDHLRRAVSSSALPLESPKDREQASRSSSRSVGEIGSRPFLQKLPSISTNSLLPSKHALPPRGAGGMVSVARGVWSVPSLNEQENRVQWQDISLEFGGSANLLVASSASLTGSTRHHSRGPGDALSQPETPRLGPPMPLSTGSRFVPEAGMLGSKLPLQKLRGGGVLNSPVRRPAAAPKIGSMPIVLTEIEL
eukprot:TRINITY_DN9314_c0_g4_i1.p1 TRINITY_DN9314_c0_g4~~TRINITY_DN9314_c0_g4_i1.p1  ORF type:complete len:899 (-),score=169.42 TRINITY_DN9314_c0_g4_i1:133-2829(-)